MIASPSQPSFDGFELNVIHSVFLAILPDSAAKVQLAELTRRLRHDRTMLRAPQDPDRWHITVNHLENFRELAPPHLVPAIGAAADSLKAKPFEVTFDQIVGVKSGLFLRPSNGSPALKEFWQALIDALIKSGLRRYVKSAFKPHLTLSYGLSEAPKTLVEPITWTARDFVLIDSLVGKHQHVELRRWAIEPD